jgi:carbonic anhydrase/acetyltransferase-like protein (isoleucine patch superfamily)
VGHRALLHGCHVERDCLIGMGAILLDNCHIEPECIIAAGALVPLNKRIPARSMVVGIPGRVVRTLSDAEIELYVGGGRHEYLRLAAEYAGWE